jgi:PAS domain S-box-containing protein
MSGDGASQSNLSNSLLLGEAASEAQPEEGLFRLLVESVTDSAIFALDPEGRIVTWNGGAERITGYRAEEALGRHVSVFYPPGEIERGRPGQGLRKAVEEGRFAEEGWRVRKDGTKFWAGVSLAPLRNPEGRMVGFATVTRDLTERHLAEERTRQLLREQAARAEAEEQAAHRLQAIVQASPLAIIALDPEGRVEAWNPSAERMFGWTEEEVIHRPNPIVPLEGENEFRELRERALRGDVLTGVEVRRRKKDGSPVDLSLSTAPLPDDEGGTRGTIVILEDISGRKQTEEALRESQERLREVVDTLPIGIFLTDATGQIVWHNPAGRRIWGGTHFVGVEGYRKYRAWWADTGREVETGEWAAVRALRGEWVTGQVVDIEGFDGSRKTILNSALPLRDSAGRVAAVMVVNEDVTERRRMEEALRRQHGFIALLQEVAVAANEASGIEEAFETSLARICARTGWPVGHALLRDATGELISTGLFHLADPQRFQSFRGFTEAIRFAPGVGLPGRVLATGRAAWIGHVAEDTFFPRARLAAELGLRPGLAVPIRVGREIVGALEFFSEQAVEPDDALLTVMDHIGTQLGRVVERERALEALRESEERFRLMFERSPLPKLVFDRETLRFLDVNEAAIRHYGYAREEFLAMTARDIRSPEEAARFEALIGRREEPFVRHGGVHHRTKDGRTIDVEVTAQDITFAGRPARLVVSLDVTERVRAEERQRFLLGASQILASAADYEALIASFVRLCVPRLGDLCLVDMVEEGGKIRRVEVAHADPEQEKVARALLEYPPSANRPEDAARVLRTGEPLLTAEVTEGMLEGMARDAKHLRVLRELGPGSFMALPLLARGRTLGAVTLAVTDSGRPRYREEDLSEVQDLAHRAAVLLDNARLYRKAEQARRAREDVLAVVSHELRNPLTAILALVEILLDGLPPETWRMGQRRQMESIRASAEQMARLVDDLLDVTRIDAGHLALRRDREEVALVVREALEMLQPLAARKSVRLESDVPEEIPAILLDRQRIHQVLSNLVANALQATPEGGAISVRVQAVENGVRFSVSDTGPGIPKEHLPHLFDRYWQGPGRTGRGLGLGLVIAKGIVEAHGGRIWAESRISAGTTLSFDIPADDEAASPAPWLQIEDSPRDSVVVLPSVRERVPGGRRPDLREQAARHQAEAAERRARFLTEISESGGSASRESPTADRLRERIVIAVHTGRLQPDDRLPSIRDVSRELGVTNHAVVQAYAALEAEGLVQRRERSGIFVAWPGDAGGALPGETANWVADLLTEACEHQIKIPQLTDLIRRSTTTVRLHCACVESDEDHLAALCAETGQQFGLLAHPVSIDALPPHRPGESIDRDDLPPGLREADLIVTSIFHAPRLRLLTEELNKPLIVGTVHPEVVSAIEQRLQDGLLTVVCADERFAERLRASFGVPHRERIRVVLASDARSMARLDPSDPVFCTRAAYGPVRDRQLRLLVPLSPFLAPQCARDLIKVLIRLNMEAERPYARPRA